MKCAVYDASYYPSNQLGVAAQMIRDDLGDDYDLLSCTALVSSVHPQQSNVIERIAKKYSRVYVGGPGALSPGNYESASGVVLGDYRTFLQALRIDRLEDLPNIYFPLHPKSVSIDQSFPYEKSARYSGEDGRKQVFCSRGCKHRCAFCQTGWACEFGENPRPKTIFGLPKGKYNYMSNALSDVSFCKLLPLDISASHTLREAVHGNWTGRLVRVGVEGVSERLRRGVSKPITNQQLVDWTLELNEKSISVRWFMIAGLPGETWEDWLEIIDCVKAYVSNHNRGQLQISFTAYVPEPSTPIARLPYSDNYDDHHRRFREWYFDKARIAYLSLFRPQGPTNRAVKAAAQMHTGNKYVEYPHRDKVASGLACYTRYVLTTAST